MAMIEDEDLLLAVLNSAPITLGVRSDQLDGEIGWEFSERFGGVGTASEQAALRSSRDALHALIRGDDDAATAALSEVLATVSLSPRLDVDGIDWRLEAPSDRRLAARTILAWSRVLREAPGRLRPCANAECNLFLIDHSRPGTARWCSMATCGNRMKARAYATRARSTS
ncbi:MAG TPA: CGNR zinc finger domain-containing protein [Microbacterium sp.]|nr:CGNR zinc finger domain-containing protein [Microbacterium sp.]